MPGVTYIYTIYIYIYPIASHPRHRAPTTPVRTLPKIRSPKKHEIQGGTLAIFFLKNIELYFVKKTHGKSRTIAPKIMKNIDKNMKFLSQNHEKLILGVSLWLLGRPLGPQGRQRRKSEPKGGSLDAPPLPRRDPKVGLTWSPKAANVCKMCPNGADRIPSGAKKTLVRHLKSTHSREPHYQTQLASLKYAK